MDEISSRCADRNDDRSHNIILLLFDSGETRVLNASFHVELKLDFDLNGSMIGRYLGDASSRLGVNDFEFVRWSFMTVWCPDDKTMGFKKKID